MHDEKVEAEREPDLVMATVYVKSEAGRSLLDAGSHPVVDPRPYRPRAEVLDHAAQELERWGFTIEGRGLTLSISGPPGLFEEASGARISFEQQQIYDPVRHEARTLQIPRSSQPVMHIKGLENTIDGVVLATHGVPLDRPAR